MARNITVTFSDGTNHVYQNAPDDITPDAVEARAAKEFGKSVISLDGGRQTKQPEPQMSSNQKLSAAEPPTWLETQLAKLPSMPSGVESRLRGFAMGAADPSVGLFQLGANVIGHGDAVNKAIANKEAQYESGRTGSGFDGARALGNIASPANIIAAGKVAPLLAGSSRVLQGAAFGSLGGLFQPVVNSSSAGDYFGQKGVQTALGAATGSVLTPAMGKLGDAIGRRMAVVKTNAGDAFARADQVISDALKEVGQTRQDINPTALQSLRQQVIDSLLKGKKLDAAASLRKADFDSLGMPALRGQITRDSNLFAKEMNLRGVANLGEPIQQRMDQQAQILQNKVGGFAAGANEAYPAGVKLSSALGAVDEKLRTNVSGLYNQARNSAGKDLDVPLQGLAQDYADVLSNFGDKVPSGVRNQFEALGLNNGVQRKVFTIESADKLLKTINANVSNDPATNRALDILRSAVKSAVTSVDDTGGVFAPAVKAAARRFKLHDAVPSLEAAANGSVAPDDFVRRFVLNGKTEEVKGMAKLLEQADPSAFQQARAQIGAELQRAAFGENSAMDKALAPERFAKVLRGFGKEKLSAFFSQQEVEQLHTIARVAAFKNSTPSNAAVNYSNSAGAMMNLLGRIPGIPAVASLASAAKNTINNSRAVDGAISASIPSSRIDIPVATRGLLDQLVGGGAIVGGGLLAGSVRK